MTEDERTAPDPGRNTPSRRPGQDQPGPWREQRHYPEHFRAADTDRQRVADQLRVALDDGRLNLLEYDERLAAAYAAQTYGELAVLTDDLPGPDAAPLLPAPAQPAEHTPARPTTALLVQQGRVWAGGAVALTGIWGASSVAAGHLLPYWPAFPVIIWGAGLVHRVISGKHRDPHT